jgi:hypothetical protein
VPQQGITRNQRGEATAMVIGADSKVELRVAVVSIPVFAIHPGIDVTCVSALPSD